MINKLEIKLHSPDDFLKIRETLSRIGIAKNDEKVLYQSCHILHKAGKYFIVHFKEMLQLDGLSVNMSDEDYERRNNIAKMLENYGLCDIVPDPVNKFTSDNKFRILRFQEAKNWKLIKKYTFGK